MNEEKSLNVLSFIIVMILLIGSSYVIFRFTSEFNDYKEEHKNELLMDSGDNLHIGINYPILSLSDSYVTILNNNKIETIQIKIINNKTDINSIFNNFIYNGAKIGTIVLDNESYLKVIWVDYSVGNGGAHSYSEIHIKR